MTAATHKPIWYAPIRPGSITLTGTAVTGEFEASLHSVAVTCVDDIATRVVPPSLLEQQSTRTST